MFGRWRDASYTEAMDGSARLRPARTAGWIIAALVCMLGLPVLGAPPAAAQGLGFFGNLFGGGQSQAPQPGYPRYGGQPDYYYYTAPRRRARRHPVEQQVQKEVPHDKPAPQKTPATSFVYVFGDSLGQLLANGLDDSLSDRPEVAIVHKGRGSSGLVAQDYYDWPKTIDALLAGKDKIDVAVMMIGSNDRQAIHEDGKTFDVGSDGWNAAYRKRVAAIDEAFRKNHVPLVWVGVPITKDNDFADDMAAFNDIFREAAAKSGATYVDTWEAFSDDNGDFDAYGPDVNGQTVRLRTSDGIYFTKAGARKLAHFVETHVRRDLDGKAPISAPPTPENTAGVATIGPSKSIPALAKVKPDVGPIRDLTEAPVAAGGALATLTSTSGAQSTGQTASVTRADPAPEKTLADGATRAAPAGRADDRRWPSGATSPPGP